ncbi:MAG: DUF2497 domain-containing protein [Mesorhizobium sp.]|nr:DUF2497 domain-containing protein [Mesorhizobium sp.]
MPQTNAAQREPSMEEILASIRRIIEDSDTARKIADDEIPAAANAPSSDQVKAFRDELRIPPVESPRAERSFFKEPERTASIAAFPATPAPEPTAAEPDIDDGLMMDEDFDAAEMEPAPEQSAPTVAENQNPKPAIISEIAGRQVAAAFGELSDAFAATRRKSFDEMAEEMIRPMLQDWLDNNLPTLVERLVREEIERVARGAVR